jgi:YVTN family beta-propeller protein
LSRIYVANYGSSTISVIDGGNNTVIETIKNDAILQPTDVAIDWNYPQVYSLIFVDNEGSNKVSVINGLTDKVLCSIGINGKPNGMVIDPVTKRLYVSTDKNSTSVISYNYNFTKGGFLCILQISVDCKRWSKT